MRRINLSQAKLEYDPQDIEGFRAALFHVGPELGAEQTGTTVYEVPPGEALCPYHYEYGEEEWLLVVEGRPTVRTPDGTEQIEPLDLVFFPKGPAGAHQIRNDTGGRVLVLMWSNVVYPTATAYPDSDKVGVWTGDKSEDLMVPRSANVSYYHGEGGDAREGNSEQENLDAARRSVKAFSAGDFELLADTYAPEASITRVPDGWPESGPFVGREAVMRQFSRLQEDWEAQSMTVEREAAQGDWVVMELRWTTRGAGSGVSLAMTVVAAFRLEGGRIAEARYFWDWQQALQAASVHA